MDEDPQPDMLSIILNEGDRELVGVAARLLMAHRPGQVREDAMDQLVQLYRNDLVEAHPGVNAETFEELVVNFGGALLLEMQRRIDGNNDQKIDTLQFGGESPQSRPEVYKVLRQTVADLAPRH
jgi:hypothetical protein